MRWTKKKRNEFKDTIDLLLAMADMVEFPENATELREVLGAKNGSYDKHVSTREFKEAEIVSDHCDAINEVSRGYEDAKIFMEADPKTDLPEKYRTAICKVVDGFATFHMLRSVPIKALRGQKLLSPWFASYSTFSMDLESGIGAGSEDVVFFANGTWRRRDTMRQAFIRRRSELPGEIIDAIEDSDPDATHKCCNLLAGLTFSRHFHWRVVIKTPEGNSFSITTDSKGAAAAFADRSGDTPSGRRSALRNWVSEHTRKTRKTTDEGDEMIRMVSVRKHLRGRVPFRWCGLDCELVVSPFDIEQNRRLAESKAALARA